MPADTPPRDAAFRRRLPIWTRLRRVKVSVYDREAWAMVERMQERVDREHAWVHRCEDEIGRLRDIIDRALVECVRHRVMGDETAANVAVVLGEAARRG